MCYMKKICYIIMYVTFAFTPNLPFYNVFLLKLYTDIYIEMQDMYKSASLIQLIRLNLLISNSMGPRIRYI